MQDKEKVAIEKLTGTIEPVTKAETSGLTNSPFDNRGSEIYFRKGLTVENYYKQVLNKPYRRFKSRSYNRFKWRYKFR